MESIQCIFCNSSSDQIVIEENGYQGHRCPECGLIFTSPRPTFAESLNLYRHDQAIVCAESHISAAFFRRICARHNLRIIKKFIQHGSMLEIGAGAGYFLDEARKQGFDVYGIELNAIQANFVRSKLGITCAESPLDVSLFDGKKFDIIYHCDVLCHFYDPIKEFEKINERLKDDGMLVFETGNLGDVEKKYYRFFKRFYYPDHLFFFSENNLKELLKRTGFEIIEIYRYSILAQLIINKRLTKVINFLKSKGKTHPNISNANDKGFNFQQLIKKAYNYFLYFLGYKIGCLMPKTGRPQTVIVIARKRR